MNKLYTLGIDIGSASSKVVILKDGKEIVGACAIQVGTGTSGPKRALEAALLQAQISIDKVEYIVATGYGRFAIDNADLQVSEITCHAKGVNHYLPHARVIIDIGGQDAKVIKLDPKGNITKFFMNDKCAAGTGRFLEVMSRVLEVSFAEMEAMHKSADATVNISSTCTVFAESEVISQLSKGVRKDNLIKGVHHSVAAKACSLVYRIGVENDVCMSGEIGRASCRERV